VLKIRSPSMGPSLRFTSVSSNTTRSPTLTVGG
jgi:hypothetical protein